MSGLGGNEKWMRPVNISVGNKKNGRGGQARADGCPAVSLPSSREGVSRCHVVEQPVIDCHEISTSQCWREGECPQNPKQQTKRRYEVQRTAPKSWEQKVALMWAWVWEAAQQRAARGACIPSFGGRWKQKEKICSGLNSNNHSSATCYFKIREGEGYLGEVSLPFSITDCLERYGNVKMHCQRELVLSLCCATFI